MNKKNDFLKIAKYCAVVCALTLYFTMSMWPTSATTARPRSKIVFCDFQRAAKESKLGKRINHDFKKVVEEKRTLLTEKAKRVERLRAELDKKSTVMDSKLKKEKEDKYFKAMRSFQRFKEDLQQDMKKKEMEASREIMLKFTKVVRDVGRDENYDAIIPKEFTVYYSKELDITDLVIKKMSREK